MNIGLGTASFGTSIPEAQSHKLMDAFVSNGGVIIDTANNYAFWAGEGGESESVIGNWLQNQQRDSVEIHTKIGAQPTDGTNLDTAEGLSKAAIDNAIEKSLQRLKTDYIDVLYAHLNDVETPLLETWSVLSDYVKRGVVKQLGVSNYPLNRVEELSEIIKENNLTPISYAQYRHSVIAPVANADLGVQVCFDDEMIVCLKESNSKVNLVAYSPLLDGAFEDVSLLSENYGSVKNRDEIKQLQVEALKLKVSPSALVLKKISDSGMLPLTMTGKLERLKGNLALFCDFKV